MFTGIIEGFGTIEGVRPMGEGRRLAIRAGFSLDATRLGDSIAVSGACLTVVTLSGGRFEADVSPETLDRTTLGRAKSGDRVNLERALRLSDRIDGHLVSGHIDGVGVLQAKRPRGNAVIVTIGVPEVLSRHMIQKGSVAVDGTSLTINECRPDGFDVSIIPHTAKLSTIGFKTVGDPVNIETDMIGKYVEKFLMGKAGTEKTGETGIDMAFLSRTGFL